MFHRSAKIPPHGSIPKFTGEKPGVSIVLSMDVFMTKSETNTGAKHWSNEQRILLALKYLSGNAQTRLQNRGMNDDVEY